MNCLYLFCVCLCTSICFGSAYEGAAVFSDGQRENALDFVCDMVNFLQENAGDHFDDAQRASERNKWERAYNAVIQRKYRVDVWTPKDESLVLATHEHMMTTDVWTRYLEDPGNLDYFEPLYNYLREYNRTVLEQQLGRSLVSRRREEYEFLVCPDGVRFDTVMLLSVFLLNETYVGYKTFAQAREETRKAAAASRSGASPTLMRSATLQSLNLLRATK